MISYGIVCDVLYVYRNWVLQIWNNLISGKKKTQKPKNENNNGNS